MSIQREVLTGALAALVSMFIIAGSFAVATTEGRSSTAQNEMASPTLTSFPTHIILVTQRLASRLTRLLPPHFLVLPPQRLLL